MSKKPKLALSDFAGVVGSATQTAPKPADAKINLSLIDFERQVRTSFPQAKLMELVASIRVHSVLEPVILLKKPDGRYRMISGERRFKASEIAGLAEIPAIIKENLTEREIRSIQITENNDRDGLTPYDEAMGVIEDVEKYGAKEAQAIWNRSESWISKRATVKKLPQPLLALFKDEKVSDLEILVTLNQLYAVDVKEFEAIASRFGTDNAPTRDEVRDKLTSIREWKAKQAAREKGKDAAQAPQKSAEKKDSAAVSPQGANPPEDAARDRDDEGESAAAKKPQSTPAPAATSTTLNAGFSGIETAESKKQRTQERLVALREELYEWGVVNREQIVQIEQQLSELDADMNQTDWVLWSGFLSIILPLINAVGDDKGAIFMKKLLSDLKAKNAAELWAGLHPTLDGSDGGPDAPRDKTPAAPAGWQLI